MGETPTTRQRVGVATRLASWRGRVLGLLGVVLFPTCAQQPDARTIELGVDVRLNGVALNYYQVDLGMMAVGEGGTVAYRIVDDDASLQTWSVGDANFHDVGFAAVPDGLLWFVVGSEGTIQLARQRDAEFTWFEQDTGVTTDLHALWVIGWNALEARVLVVGDEVVLLGQATDVLGVFSWTSLEPPPGGWGRLRAIGKRERYDDGALFTVSEYIVAGKDGRAWLGDLESPWRALELDTSNDLRDGAFGHLCGEAGTLVECGDREPCTVRQFGEADFEVCRASWWVDSRARIFAWNPSPGEEPHDQLDWQPRAAEGNELEMVMVGDGGRAIVWTSNVRYCE